MTQYRSISSLHPWIGRTKECWGIDPGRHGRLNHHGIVENPGDHINCFFKKGEKIWLSATFNF